MSLNYKFPLDADKFVTVVSVDKDEAVAEAGEGEIPHLDCPADFSIPTKGFDISSPEPMPIDSGVRNEMMEDTQHTSQSPRPAPRQFVTVVSVGGTEKLEMRTNGDTTLESSLRVRLDVSQEEIKEDTSKEQEVNPSHEKYKRPKNYSDEKDQVTRHTSTDLISINPNPTAESRVPDQVVVFRLPGERLGLGLKFDGGMGATEKIRRLFIQSVAPDSPASRATVPWGDLDVGDQILHIEGRPVSSMTRVECVSLLKEASVKLTIGVLKGNGNIPEAEDYGSALSPSSQMRISSCMRKGQLKRVPPPPLPPRIHPRKSPARPPKEVTDWCPPPHGFEDLDGNEELAEKVARLSRANSFTTDDWDGEVTALMASHSSKGSLLPPTPAFYLNLLSEEERGSRGRCESESDETNSSASTVVDRLSISSSRTVSRNSSFNAAADPTKFDLARALSPFEHLEKELNSEKRQRLLSNSHVAQTELTNPVETDLPEDNELFNQDSEYRTDLQESSKFSPEVKIKSPLKSLSLNSTSFSWHNKKGTNENSNKSQGVSLKKSTKRQAPLPPPRSISSLTNASSNYEAAPINRSLQSIEPESDHFMDEYDSNDFGEVFENENFPSIVERTTGKPLESCESSSPAPHTDSDSILKESKSRQEKVSKDEDFTTYEESKENCLENEPIIISKSSENIVDNLCYFIEEHNSEDEKMKKDSSFKSLSSSVLLNDSYGSEYQNEPLNTETYELKREFFIDNVSNPSYGFPPLVQERKLILPSKKNSSDDDELYEEVNASPIPFSTSLGSVLFQSEVLKKKENYSLDHPKSSSDISSISSQSISSLSLSSKEMETSTDNVTSENIVYTSNNSVDNANAVIQEETKPAVSKSPSPIESTQDQTEDLYDYMDVLPSAITTTSPAIQKRFSQTSSQLRLREDLSQLLRQELKLGQDAHVEVEEEEVVESVVECETEEELLLVLRALHSDNSLSLDEQ